MTCDGLTEAKTAFINSKLYETLGVVYLSEIKDCDLIRNDSKRGQAVFVDSECHSRASHFPILFTTKNVCDLFNFTITLLDESGNKLNFPSHQTKVPTLTFKIQIVKKKVSKKYQKF